MSPGRRSPRNRAERGEQDRLPPVQIRPDPSTFCCAPLAGARYACKSWTKSRRHPLRGFLGPSALRSVVPRTKRGTSSELAPTENRGASGSSGPLAPRMLSAPTHFFSDPKECLCHGLHRLEQRSVPAPRGTLTTANRLRLREGAAHGSPAGGRRPTARHCETATGGRTPLRGPP